MTQENIQIIKKNGWSADGTTPVVLTVQVKEKSDGDEVHTVLNVEPLKLENNEKEKTQGGED